MDELTRGIKSINIDAEIDRVFGAYSVSDFFDNTVGTNLVNLAGLDNLKAAISIVLIVTWARERGADARMDVGVVGKQALLGSMIKICAVIDASLLRGCASKNFWLPCVAVVI
jgi:hypothetical protein